MSKKGKEKLNKMENKENKSETDNKKNTGKQNTENSEKSILSRRRFLGKAAAAGVLGAGILSLPNLLGKSSLGLAQDKFEEVTVCTGGCEFAPKTGAARADMAYNIRVAAAKYERDMPIPTHPCNGDEALYSNRNFFASFTKGLKRSSVTAEAKRGEVDPVEYCKLLSALQTGNPGDFELILLGFSNNCADTAFSEAESTLSADAFLPNKQRRLESPQAGLNYDLEGKDYYQLVNRNPNATDPPVAFPPAFKFNSKEEVAEIVENYWQALTRDVAFINYPTDNTVSKAADDLNRKFQAVLLRTAR